MTGESRYFFYDWQHDTADPARAAGLYVYDRITGSHIALSAATMGSEVQLGGVSDSGRYVHYDKPTPNAKVARASYLLDRVSGRIERTSWSGRGRRVFGAAGDVSNNGRVAVFGSMGDYYARNVARGKTKIVSVAPTGKPRGRASLEVSLSGNGRFVAWTGKPDTRSGNKYTQIWVHDRVTRRTQLVSRAKGGGYGNAASRNVSISNEGRRIAFTSQATDLERKRNGTAGSFVRDLDARRTTLLAKSTGGLRTSGCGSMYEDWDCVAISGDGRFVVFWTAESLIPEDTDATSPYPSDLYIRDLATGEVNQINVAPAGSTGPADGRTGGYNGLVLISTDGRYVAWDDIDDTLDPTSIPAERRFNNYYVRDRELQG